MGQPVKVSDGMILDARLMAEAAHRSIAGQIEHWAMLGRAMERVLRGDQIIALCREGALRPLSALVESVDSRIGHRRVADYLTTLPYPHYEPADRPGFLVRIDRDGTRTIGRFVNRQFQPSKKARR
ncbi:MAG: hypothetical protein HYX75_23520 [Acidobacteria bacterium]|nr:hypothetical protein [Acidobacteriota bacterium]